MNNIGNLTLIEGKNSVNGHKGNVEFSKTYLVPSAVKIDKYSISGKLIFRACDNHICTLPQELPFNAGILVTNK